MKPQSTSKPTMMKLGAPSTLTAHPTRARSRLTGVIWAIFSIAMAIEPVCALELDPELRRIIAQNGLTGSPRGSENAPDPFALQPSLGRALFFSKQLSGDKDVACVSCHHPLLGGTDRLSLPVGIAAIQPDVVGPGRRVDPAGDRDPKAATIGGPNVARNTLSTFNATLYRSALLHDQRISVLGHDDAGKPLYRTPDSTLRSAPDPNATGNLLAVQARFPVTGFDEMRGFGEFYTLTGAQMREAIADRLRSSGNWTRPFAIAFRLPDATADEVITFDNIAAALAAYQDSQVFVATPWREYVLGNSDALTQDQKQGAILFFESVDRGGYGCAACHRGDFFTDERAHVTGLPQLGRGKRADGDDPGRFLVTQHKDDLYRFRTPTLINVTETGPWGHAGSFDALADMIAYHANPETGYAGYDFSLTHLEQFSGGGAPASDAARLTQRAIARVSKDLPHRSPDENELTQLVAFMAALTDPCITSRECLQPWIAGIEDDQDGQLLQPLFYQGEAPPVTSTTAQKDEPPEDEARPTPGAPGIQTLGVKALQSCRDHSPQVTDPGENRFVERSAEMGIGHEHHVPGAMWYGRQYSYVVEFAMEPAPVVAGDINQDCWPDLLFATHTGDAPEALIYLNRHGSEFQLVDTPMEGLPDAIGALGLADLNGDYRLDLMVGNMFGAREMGVYTNVGTNKLELAQHLSMSKVIFGFAFADVNQDGWVDTFAAHWDRNARPGFAPALMMNQGGTLYPADESAGTSGAYLDQNFHFSPGFADFDGDHDMDLVIASDFGTSEVLENQGDGRFRVVTDREVITDENGMGSAIGDFNNDGTLDWFVSAISKAGPKGEFQWGVSGNRLYLGSAGELHFTNVTEQAGVRSSGWSWGSCAADFDNDGWLDLFVENGFGLLPDHVRPFVPAYIYGYLPNSLAEFHRSRPALFMNQGNARFEDKAAVWGINELTNGRGVVCVDIDRDGDIDLVTTQNSAAPRVWVNHHRGMAGNHFVGFHLIGNQPNTSAIGATVVVEANGMRQMRQVQMNSNYQSQNPATVHFGVGLADQVERLEVTWPDGLQEHLGPVPLDRYYPLIHPDLRDLSLTDSGTGAGSD